MEQTAPRALRLLHRLLAPPAEVSLTRFVGREELDAPFRYTGGGRLGGMRFL